MRNLEKALTPYLEHLQDLPFIRDVQVLTHAPESLAPGHGDVALNLKTPRAEYEFTVELKRTHLNRAHVDGLLARMAQFDDRRWILFAPYIGRPIGQYLADNGVNYVDEAGNCQVQIGQEYIATIQGRRKKTTTHGRGVGVAGYRVLFAILARPELLNAPVRTVAAAAGVSKNAAAHAIARVTEDGIAAGQPGKRRLIDKQTLLDRWLAGYATIVRPRLLVGSFRTPDKTPVDLERQIDTMLQSEKEWAWGGGAAAMRLTRFYRGEDTVLHVTTWAPHYQTQLKALKAKDGHLIVLGVPGEIAFDGALPRTVHPLLVYTELITTGGPRAREAAAEIQREYLDE